MTMRQIARPFLLTIGVIATALAVVGAALPIMPTVPFLIVAVYCFARSNPAFERKILDHPYFGPQVRDWNERRAIRRSTKLIAIAAMACGVVFTWATLGAPYYYVSIAILVIAGAWIWTRPE